MKVLNAHVSTNGSTYRPHKLEVLVDHIPKYDEHRWIKKSDGDGGAFYFSELDGIIAFLYHNPKKEQGFYGREFKLTMEDGTIETIKGPWSSNSAEIMTQFDVDWIVDVSITDDPKAFERGYTFVASHIKFEHALTALRMAKGDWRFTETDMLPYDDHPSGLLYWVVERFNCPTAEPSSQPCANLRHRYTGESELRPHVRTGKSAMEVILKG